ncbi:MAG: TIGR00730 family Rossman fold protein [Odoribacter sp.]
MKIAVFCASANNIDEVFFDTARELGEKIGEKGWHLFYGGTNMGLMKEVAEATIRFGGEVTGIIPECIYKKGVAAKLNHLIIASDMKERKYLLREQADAFIALPGGWGTLEEITEVITLKQLEEHHKPILFLNTQGFYDPFLEFIQTIQKQGFISSAYNHIYQVVEQVEEAFQYLSHYKEELIVAKY